MSGAVIILDPAVVVLIGAAGAGKSTWAARCRPEQVLCLDTYRAAVADDECDQEATPDAVRLLDLVLDARCSRQLTSVVDTTAADTDARQHLIDVAARHGLPVVAVVLDTPLETCLARQSTRPGPTDGARWGRAVPAAVITAQHHAIRAALPGLLDEGFTAVHHVGAEPACLT